MRIVNEIVFNAVNNGVTQTSAAIPIDQLFGVAAQFVLTGSPNGTISMQVSCDAPITAPFFNKNATNWTVISGSSTSVASAGNVLFNVDIAYYNWVQFVWTPSGGSGTLSGRMNGKGQ